jgi:hypothetical protein
MARKQARRGTVSMVVVGGGVVVFSGRCMCVGRYWCGWFRRGGVSVKKLATRKNVCSRATELGRTS